MLNFLIEAVLQELEEKIELIVKRIFELIRNIKLFLFNPIVAQAFDF